MFLEKTFSRLRPIIDRPKIGVAVELIHANIKAKFILAPG
jgi:hypothetical protein